MKKSFVFRIKSETDEDIKAMALLAFSLRKNLIKKIREKENSNYIGNHFNIHVHEEENSRTIQVEMLEDYTTEQKTQPGE